MQMSRRLWIMLAVAGMLPLAAAARVDAVAAGPGALRPTPAQVETYQVVGGAEERIVGDELAYFVPQSSPYAVTVDDGPNPLARFAGQEPATVNLRPWGTEFTFLVKDPSDEALGATLQPVPDAVRAQLKLPTGRGLVVAEIEPEGPAARSGLRRHDILLTLADQPIATSADLEKHLKAAGEKDVPLTLLRKGRPVTLQVRPVYRVTIGPIEKESTEYVLGVMLGTIDDALRAQLALGDKPGLLINEVVGESPAAKAGIKAHDILLKYGSANVTTQADLAKLVNDGKGKSVSIELLREGKPLTIEVTPERRTIKTAAGSTNAYRFYSVNPTRNPAWRAFPDTFNRATPPMLNNLPLLPPTNLARPSQPDLRINALQKRLESLQETVEKLRSELEAERSKKE